MSADPLSREERDEVVAWAKDVIATPNRGDLHGEAHYDLRWDATVQSAEVSEQRFRDALAIAADDRDAAMIRAKSAEERAERLRSFADHLATHRCPAWIQEYAREILAADDEARGAS